MKVEIRKIDPQGRVLLPSEWRKRVLGDKKEVLIISLSDRIEIFPRVGDLEEFIDSIEIDIPENKFLDYHELRRVLRGFK